jgi:hypothetical protein
MSGVELYQANGARGAEACDKDLRDETMKSEAALTMAVAARLVLCHKSSSFSATHYILRLDDL